MEISAAWLRSLLVAVVSTAVWLILAARRRTAEAVEAGEGVAVSCTAPHRGAATRTGHRPPLHTPNDAALSAPAPALPQPALVPPPSAPTDEAARVGRSRSGAGAVEAVPPPPPGRTRAAAAPSKARRISIFERALIAEVGGVAHSARAPFALAADGDRAMSPGGERAVAARRVVASVSPRGPPAAAVNEEGDVTVVDDVDASNDLQQLLAGPRGDAIRLQQRRHRSAARVSRRTRRPMDSARAARPREQLEMRSYARCNGRRNGRKRRNGHRSSGRRTGLSIAMLLCKCDGRYDDVDEACCRRRDGEFCRDAGRGRGLDPVTPRGEAAREYV